MKTTLPETRPAIVHRFTVGPASGYLRVGLGEDGSPMELFVNMQRSQDAGWVGCFGVMFSMARQRGVELSDICNKMEHQQFEPRGKTKNPEIPFASSVPDYIAKFLRLKFLQ